MKKIGLPILTGLVILLLIFLHQLSILQEKPDEEWSRTIDLDVATEDSEMFVKHEEEESTLYFSGDPVRKIVVNEQLETSSENLEYTIPEGYSFYVDDKQAIYKKKDEIIYARNGKEQSILNKIEGINASNDGVIAWSRHTVYSISPEGTIDSETELPQHIKGGTFAENGQLFLYVQSEDTNQFLTLDPGKEPVIIHETPLSSGELYSNLQMIQVDETVTFTYTVSATRQGTRVINTYFGESIGREEATVNLLKITNVETGDSFPRPNYFSLTKVDGKPHLLFSADGEISPKRSVISIYEASRQDGEWLASRRSTSEELSIRPVSITDQSLVWMDQEDNGLVLHGASTDSTVIKSSNETSKDDLKFALYYTFTAIVGMFAMLAFSFGFLILPAVALMYLYFANTTAVEQDKSWVEWTIVLLCVGSQMIFLPSILDGPFQNLAPTYLTFEGAPYVWPVIIFLVSFIISRIGQDQEWTILQRTSYQLGLNLGILIFLLGPYIL
ncbi:hypothetical protein [Guptibacillus hwajinpoensis]|uniref:hypothetical protein n=1 Tax=Guptibacillus hwajinpoensis TaxID=208199 RepID=UPI001CFE1DE2|nr:hypothetical protein [Pseudalkalibacillus hwajinpoensis]WLR60934.1 hypothetical protein LC071_06300 [Pseudalkalibacillus hwajinpoensis]